MKKNITRGDRYETVDASGVNIITRTGNIMVTLPVRSFVTETWKPTHLSTTIIKTSERAMSDNLDNMEAQEAVVLRTVMKC